MPPWLERRSVGSLRKALWLGPAEGFVVLWLRPVGPFRRRRYALGPAPGRWMRTLVPWPGVLSARIVPPCSSTICRAIARPRPVPFTFVV